MAGPVIIKTTFLLRRGSEEEWVTKNPILKYGEPGIAVDTMNFKIGDGETPWNDLDSISGGLAEPIDCVDAGTTPYGVVWNTGEGAVTGTLNTEDAESAFYFVPSSTTGTQAQGQYERSLTGGAIVYFPYGENWFKFTATEFDIREKAVRYLISASGDQYTYEQIASLHNLEIRSVNELPTASIDTLNAIYLVPSASGETKEEYVTVVDTVQGETVYSWDQIGDTEIDLSGYAHKIVGGTTGNLVAFDNTGDLVDSGSKVSDFQSKIQYVTLEHGSGTLTQAQHDILFAQNGYACIVYQDVNGQSILERSGVSGSVFYWTATEINGNQLLTKQIGVNFTTDAWEYSVKELEEKIDLIEIDTSTLPATLNQTTYNTLFSSKLNKIVDIAQDDHHTRNRVYSYVDDIFDDVAEKTYTRFGCTYSDGNDIIRSIIVIDRSNRSCAAPVDYLLNQSYSAGDNINISNNVISYSGIEFIDKTPNQVEYTPLTQDEIAKLISGKAAIRIPSSYGSTSGIYYLISDYDNKLILAKFEPAPGLYAEAGRIKLATLIFNKTTGALVKQNIYASRDIVVATNIESSRITKFDTNSDSQKGAGLIPAVAGTDYIAPGDSRLIPSGGTTGQFLVKSSDSNYATEWESVPRIYDIYEIADILDAGDPLPSDLLAIQIYEEDGEAFWLIYNNSVALSNCFYISKQYYGGPIELPYPFRVNVLECEDYRLNGIIYTAIGNRPFYAEKDVETGDSIVVYGDWTSDTFITQSEKITDVDYIDSNVNVPTGAVVKEYVDSTTPKVFEVTLNKDSWEDNEQVVEHTNFFADGVLYSVESKTNLDNIIATEAEIEAIEVTDGEMTFAYGGTAPSANVTFVIRAELVEIEEPVEPPITAKSIITTLSYDSEDNQVLTPPVDVEEVYAAVLNGELYYIVLTYPDGMVSQSVINEVVTNNSGTYAIKFNFGTIGLEDGNQFIDIDVR